MYKIFLSFLALGLIGSLSDVHETVMLGEHNAKQHRT
jgi:hypothetical protein